MTGSIGLPMTFGRALLALRALDIGCKAVGVFDE